MITIFYRLEITWFAQNRNFIDSILWHLIEEIQFSFSFKCIFVWNILPFQIILKILKIATK